MSQISERFEIVVWGDFACFTRPEMKVERVTYDVMTPSAARNILQAILWKPAIDWIVEEIHVLSMPTHLAVRRNEVGCVTSVSNAAKIMKAGVGNLGIFAEDERQQRAAIILKDVNYLIRAKFQMTNKAGQSDNIKKFEEMFKRRLERGQCIFQPYLGCREFAAFFAPATGKEQAIELSKDLSWMLYDLNYLPDGQVTPEFFHAKLENGVLSVPLPNSEEVKR